MENSEEKKDNDPSMKNISINIPDIYDERIHELIHKKVIPSRSAAIRAALREFLSNEYNTNLELIGFWDN